MDITTKHTARHSRNQRIVTTTEDTEVTETRKREFFLVFHENFLWFLSVFPVRSVVCIRKFS